MKAPPVLLTPCSFCYRVSLAEGVSTGRVGKRKRKGFKLSAQCDGFCYYSDLISQTQTKTKTQDTGHTGTNIHTHKYILTPPVMCPQQLPGLHWMNNFLIPKFTWGPQCFNCSKKSYICWFDSTGLSPSFETQRMLIEMV